MLPRSAFSSFSSSCTSLSSSTLTSSQITGSGENGGVIKAFNNTVKGAKKVTYYAKDNTNFDAYEASSRDEQLPSSVKALAGGTSYDNFDTNSSIMYACTPDDPATVPATVTGWLGAGRMGHGDFKWQFDNKKQDENYGVIAELKAELKSYKSSFYDFYDGVANANYGEFTGSGGDPEKNEDFTPTWSGSDTSDDDDDLTIAKKWDFTKWSSESQATIKSGSWTAKGDGTDRYTLTLTKDAAQSIGLAETEGLTFSGSNIMVSFDSKKGSYIQGSMTFHVAVSEGDVVSVEFANTGSKNGSRDLLMNGEAVASSANTTKVTGQYTIPAGISELTIAGSGSLNFYSLTIAKETGDDDDDDDPTSAKDAIAADVARTEYYTLGGARVATPTRGVNIVRTVYTDGSVRSHKIMTR